MKPFGKYISMEIYPSCNTQHPPHPKKKSINQMSTKYNVNFIGNNFDCIQIYSKRQTQNDLDKKFSRFEFLSKTDYPKLRINFRLIPHGHD